MRVRTVIFRVLALICAVPAAFFTYFGILLIYTALTFDGEGSLGHVGMYIAAGLFPLLAILFGGFTYLAWRTAHRGRAGESRLGGP
ncbi:MAG TPA: hypothetical protein VMN81_01320 [Vicinamibacterales bacterium]|nr:hypothetical protein [Vicinamibacterales bacterium]